MTYNTVSIKNNIAKMIKVKEVVSFSVVLGIVIFGAGIVFSLAWLIGINI
jgi:hypothetical protein